LTDWGLIALTAQLYNVLSVNDYFSVTVTVEFIFHLILSVKKLTD